MVSDLRQAFHVDNLRRAWRWLNTNPDPLYKGYFRHIYRAYAISAEENLADLSGRLKREIFQPHPASKVYFPKKSGIQRPYTLLTIEDQIVYLAMVNTIALRLLPRVRRRYDRQVFGHQYAGPRSRFFYRDWRRSYRKFGDAIRSAHKRGFLFTASFDLTACYDSIDHRVLSYFLQDLGLTQEFVAKLQSHLTVWTAAPAEKRIYQGHGIPQGPPASGLLSEVVLRYFDENQTAMPRSLRYFRYVDDIRFFAKREYDLRRMVVEMDLLSKQIGLFPQSSKISIHRVTNIDDEIKSISHPPEPLRLSPSPNQARMRKRLAQLSPRYKVPNETRFKYVLARAEPNAAVSRRLLHVLRRQPHLYVSIFGYFERYGRITEKVSAELLAVLKEIQLYGAFTAAGFRALRGRCHPDVQPQVMQWAKKTFDRFQPGPHSEVRAAAVSILLTGGAMKWKDILDYTVQEKDWWPRAELLQHVQINQIGQPSYESLVNSLLKDPTVDVSIGAAEAAGANSLNLIIPLSQVNPVAQLSLKRMGLIGARRGAVCPVMGDVVASVNLRWT